MWRARGTDRRSDHMARMLIGDAEAFLTGHLVERLEDRGAWAPAWSWTNLLAHGSEDDLELERTGQTIRQHNDYRVWREARSFLAGEVLDVARAYGSLISLQEEILRPIELESAAWPLMEVWNRDQWVSRIQSALNLYRRMHQETSGGDSRQRM